MGFILDGLDSESYDRQYKDSYLVKRVWKYFKEYKNKLFLVSATLFLASLAGAAGPVLISRAIDSLKDSPSYLGIFFFTGLIALIGAAAWLFNYVRQRVTAYITGNVVLNLRTHVAEKTLFNDMSFFDTHPTGKIISRITSDTQDFSEIIDLVIDVLSQFLLVILIIIWLFSINVGLSLILLAMAPLAILIALAFRKLARGVTRNSKRVNAKINAQIQESISGIMIAKSFRKEKSLFTDFVANNTLSYRVGIRRGIVLNLIFPIISLASGAGTAALAYLAGLKVLAGMTPGSWYLFMLAVGFFWWPMLNISSFWSQLQNGLSAAERIFALIDTQATVNQLDSQKIADLKGAIEFKNVGFSYNSQETVLENFSLSIKPGETVAFVGHTGAGKSSLAKLITRFYEFQNGRLTIDGMDIRSLDLADYRRQIGIVPQDPYLFSGTVAENIRYGRPEASEQDILYAATHLGNGDWLNELPHGIHTDVGQRGSSISLGQRQLVALARILLKNPAIFILDEATASIDPFTEVQIQDGLNSVFQGRTALVIAHRLTTVKNADRIIVLENGKIIEEGSHAGLLAGEGHYAQLYNTYFRHQSLEYIEHINA